MGREVNDLLELSAFRTIRLVSFLFLNSIYVCLGYRPSHATQEYTFGFLPAAGFLFDARWSLGLLYDTVLLEVSPRST